MFAGLLGAAAQTAAPAAAKTGLSGLLGNVGSLLSGSGGLGQMFGGGGSSDIAKADSRFYSGSFNVSETDTVVVVAALGVILIFLLVFRDKK
jgi:hypothetical protein